MKWAAVMLAVGACALLGYFLIGNYVQAKRFDAVVLQADRHLAARDFDLALVTLDGALETAKGERAVMRVLRRVHGITRVTDNALDLQYFAGKALERFPRSTSVGYLAAYAALRGGNYERALLLTAGHAGDELFDSLRLEAALRSGNTAVTAVDIAGAELSVERLLEAEARNDPASLENVGRQMGESRLLLDAALLWARLGRFQDAFRVLTQEMQRSQYPEVVSLIAYDAGRYEVALSTFETLLSQEPHRMDALSFIEDTLVRLGQTNDALGYYYQEIRETPGVSWIPYVNVAQILFREGDTETALDYLRRARVRFPDQPEVVYEMSRVLALSGEDEQAMAALKTLQDWGEQDPMSRLLLLRLKRDSVIPEAYAIRLWSIFNDHPDDSDVCGAIVGYLLGYGDLEGAEAAIDQLERAVQPTVWSLYTRAVIHALAGNFRESRELLLLSLGERADWRVRYALAVVDLSLRRAGSALESLEMARKELESARYGDQTKAWLSKMDARAGEAYLMAGDETKARKALSRSLELDPYNFRSLFLLKKLEAGVES